MSSTIELMTLDEMLLDSDPNARPLLLLAHGAGGAMERDPFGQPEEVATYDLANTIRIHWLEDGDHSLAARGRSGAGC